MCSRRGKKRLNDEPATGEVPKRRRGTPGFTPFKQVEIPASWKFESQKLWEAVRTSVAHCHYDDPSKRERLGNAVFEALSGQKTMKAAATMHGVPFTTLQTYFHRSRARMAKMMSDSDNAPPEQIQIPVSLSLSSSDMDNALAEEDDKSSAKSSKSGRLDLLLGVLGGKVVEHDASDNGSSPSPDVAPRKTGSSKRKPKEVHRITPTSPPKIDSLEDEYAASLVWFNDQLETMLQLMPNGVFKSINANGDEIITKYDKEEMITAIRSVVIGSTSDGDFRKSVKWIIDGILDKSLNIVDLCNLLKLDPALIQSNLYRAEQILNCAATVAVTDGSLLKNENDKNRASAMLSSASESTECSDRIEKCVMDVCRVSHYPNLQKEALRKAVAMVIRGEYSVSGAASMMQLPTSTVHPYVHRARAALETLVPQQAETSVEAEATADEYALHSGAVSKEVETVISNLVKISSYDMAGQQRLHDALAEVLTKDVPVTEISKKYGISASAFQPYITKARVLLGQSPYPTTSSAKDSTTTTALNIKLANDAAKQTADQMTAVNNFGKMLVGSSRGNILASDSVTANDTNFTATGAFVVQSDNAKARSKRGRRCKSTEFAAGTKKKESATENSLTTSNLSDSVSAGEDSDSSSDEFDDTNHNLPNVAKIRPRRGGSAGNMENVTHSGEMAPSTKSVTVLHSENGHIDSGDNEFDGLPRSIRGVAKLLSDTKLDKIGPKDYNGTPESLGLKIDKVLRQYRFRGDREKMRDGILEVLYESKTLSEACKGNSLAPTTLSTYVRLVKALINTDKAGGKGIIRSVTSPNSVKLIKNENDLSSGNSSQKSELRNGTLIVESVEKDGKDGSAANAAPMSVVGPSKVGNDHNFGIFWGNIELSNGICPEQLAKNGAKGALSTRSSYLESKLVKTENDDYNSSVSSIQNGATFPTKSFEQNSWLKWNGAATEEEGMKIAAEQLIQNVDVMMLHSAPIMNNLETFYKLLIAYLIEQQYRRSEEAQEKMRASLEYVLLDGLSIAEALKVHRGPTEHVLQVYLNRCREANKCIKTEFEIFKANIALAVSKNYATISKAVVGSTSAVQTHNSIAGVTKNNVKRSSKRLQKKEDCEPTGNTSGPIVGTLKHLNAIFLEDFLLPLYDYLKKLDDVNFPVEDCLIVGLAKMIVDELPVKQKITFTASVWDQWLASYRKEHPEFED